MLTGLNESYGITTKLASTSNDCPRQTVPSALPRIEERHPGSPCLLFQRLYHRRHETLVYRDQLVGSRRRRIHKGRRGSVAGGVPVTIRYAGCQATLTAKWRHRPQSQTQRDNTVTVSSISASRSASVPKGFSAPRADSGLVIPNWDSSSSSSSSFYSSCSLDALACIHCISSFPARSCRTRVSRRVQLPLRQPTGSRCFVAFTPRRLFTSLLSLKQPPPFSPILFDFDQHPDRFLYNDFRTAC